MTFLTHKIVFGIDIKLVIPGTIQTESKIYQSLPVDNCRYLLQNKVPWGVTLTPHKLSGFHLISVSKFHKQTIYQV